MVFNCVDKAVPLGFTEVQSNITRLDKNHVPYGFALTNQPKLFANLEIFKVDFGFVSKGVNCLLTHYAFIGLGNDGDKEVEEHDDLDEAIEEPNYPNNVDHDCSAL